ncbi:hypothetical protein EYF80_023737 [Liparis tanakae]|uniref:Uncharacterized protein n=1 Tax=Liparis tanakae TaxID=230148 RepID=A0A4Z2HK62_9TELE|nr:hypothetical protein EYF80_023737 [Liparis tanakae]
MESEMRKRREERTDRAQASKSSFVPILCSTAHEASTGQTVQRKVSINMPKPTRTGSCRHEDADPED